MERSYKFMNTNTQKKDTSPGHFESGHFWIMSCWIMTFCGYTVQYPPLWCGGGAPSLREGGWESPNSDEGTYPVVLYIYFLLCGRACICKPFKEPRKRFPAWRVGTTTLFVVPARQATSYRPARLHRLVESISRNRFLGFINVYKYGLYWHWQLEQWRETYVSR
jgi:hypothetical protein